MKQILLPLSIALLAAATPCLAQSKTTISFSDGATCSPAGPPVFDALSVVVKADSSASIGAGGAGAGRVTFDDVALTRNFDSCSVSLYGLLFQQQRVRSVTISFQSVANGSYRETLKITLANVILTSISDTAAAGGVGTQERVALTFESITIFDPVTGKSITTRR